VRLLALVTERFVLTLEQPTGKQQNELLAAFSRSSSII
jgi:hypothetical protein